ncbi:formyltetrahydrofolate deformylase [Marinobacter sp. UBA2498]|uniref:formyltetrahydrofolate deformylase n=1 Tax=Marinobacter sp. UBA2498 TaxID=1946813 RepID=UPI00258068B4|nr:formyltetrahydrofolate deformylase [Marinobacter sp. UBA2498]
MHDFILTLSCADKPGIVAGVTSELFGLGANIAESNQFWDKDTDKFFMRIGFTAPDGVDKDAVERALKPVIERFEMKTAVIDEARVPRIVILVSKFDHAMLHLLYQIKVGALRAEVAAIISNHEDARSIAQAEGVPFYHLPVAKGQKAEQEAEVLKIIKAADADLVVLARYMQILSDQLSTRLFGKVINIHHSFLPSFKGAKPYHQAHERGVKLIGATAHYVTPDLDEGPIIEQDVIRITHSDSIEDMVRLGKDVEKNVLARGLRSHIEDRVITYENKTVVFD